MSSFEVSTPILNSAFGEPTRYWYIREGETPELRDGRRQSMVFQPRNDQEPWDLSDGVLEPLADYERGFALTVVNLLRERISSWRDSGYPGVTRTTLELLEWWRRDGREKRLFFAQIEAAETIIFLNEARADLLQGVRIPRDEPGENKAADGYSAFIRYACKMATGSGKTTVMGMLSAWSILNKVNNRGDKRFSDVVLIICPNITIRDRLRELGPELGEASLYRTRDLVPPHLLSQLTRGKVLISNWHVFELQEIQTGGTSARVVKAGVPLAIRETIQVAAKNTTARGKRYLTESSLRALTADGSLHVLEERHDTGGTLIQVVVESIRNVESDNAFVERVLGRDIGGKQNILVMNDEAHHAYRIGRDEPDEDEDARLPDEEDAEEFFKEATVWIDGLDRINKQRGINFCLDLSATPYYLGRVGKETGKPFPWVVSDFGLIDAIESGLVKIPQLAVRDTTGAEIPGFFNIWKWIMEKLTPSERGGKRASPKPEAILKYANHPIAMLGALWQQEAERWSTQKDDKRPPVFILVCKNTQIARALYEWLAEDLCPTGVPPIKIPLFRNRDGLLNTIRVDSKVIHETDTGEAKDDRSRWMRLTLDTIGKTDWPRDRQGRPLYPAGFENLAMKLERSLHPPGRDVKCIVSVGMLTEGWDANTVTHIIGLRPFMSQLLCEQVVGRGLRRVNYQDLDEEDKFGEEVATVFGVPFHIIPFKAAEGATPLPPVKRHNVHALPARAEFEIRFPRVEGYTQAIRNRITVDWATVPKLVLDPGHIPPEVEMKGLAVNNQGRASLAGPGKVTEVTLAAYRAERRLQELVFDLARDITRTYASQSNCSIPTHVLFPQAASIIERYLREKVEVKKPADIKDIFLAPYYAWAVERLAAAIQPDTSHGEAPEVPRYETSRPDGTTADVSFWTSKDVRPVMRSHVNYVVADTRKWEQQAAYYLDTSKRVAAFVKNEQLGFAIRYLHNGQMHDYLPDFIIKLAELRESFLILETKGFDPLAEVKQAAAERWVNAVNADGTKGQWSYAMVRSVADISHVLQ